MIILIFALRCWWSAEGKRPAITSYHSASKPAAVRQFPVRGPVTTWLHFRITSPGAAASFWRRTDERLCHPEPGRRDFFTWLSRSSASKPCFPLCRSFSSLSPAPLCIYAWKPEAASFAGRSLLINKTWGGDDDDEVRPSTSTRTHARTRARTGQASWLSSSFFPGMAQRNHGLCLNTIRHMLKPKQHILKLCYNTLNKV